MASMAEDTAAGARASGFKRILVRLDDDTRRKYCCRALGEDLQEVQQRVAACAEAMAQARQVEDATRQLEATQSRLPSANVTALLTELEDLQATFRRAASALLGRVHETARTTDKHDTHEAQVKADKEPLAYPSKDARELLGKFKATEKSFHRAKRHEKAERLATAVDALKQFVGLMPAADASVPPEELLWWKRYAQGGLSNLRGPVLDYAAQLPKELSRFGRTAKKAADKIPELASLARNTEKLVAKKKEELATKRSSKSKKRLAVLLPEADKSSASSTVPGAAVVTAPAATAKPDEGNDGASGSKSLSIEKARSLLTRCAREVKTLRDKFEVGAYDVNLDRMITIVDAVLSQLSFEELSALSTALFTLVEMTEKVVNVTKRRDRIVCLKSVLDILTANSSVLELSTRRKTMIEEYANNCQQSLRLLNHAINPKTGPAVSGTSSRASSSPAAPAAKAEKTQTARDGDATPWPKNHVRFG